MGVILHLSQLVSVGLLLNGERGVPVPRWVRWDQKTYRVEEVGLYHTVRKGNRKIHVFSVNVGTLDMRLEIDGETLAATLTEVSDGLAD